MAKVKIQGNASGTGILTVTAPNTDTDRTITLPDEDVTLGGGVDGIVSSANATAITIDSSENVGIGVTPAMASASYNGLHIGETYPTMKLSSTATGHTATDGFHLRIDSTPRVEYWNYENTDQVFANNNGEKLRILAGGGITFNGDTASANALDDYEEGTWTPTYTNATASGHRTTGNYIRVGRLCYFTYYSGAVTLSNTGGAAIIGGLPFTVDNVNSNYPVFGYVHGTAVTNCAGWHGDVNQTTMYAVQNDSTGYAPFQTGSKQLMVSGVYMVLEGS